MSLEHSSLLDESNVGQGGRQIYNPTQRELSRDDSEKPDRKPSMSYRTWVALRVFRRDDIKYAAKVGIGAVLYAMWSFVPETRKLYGHWRGEWGLLSYMLVCSMVSLHHSTLFFWLARMLIHACRLSVLLTPLAFNVFLAHV